METANIEYTDVDQTQVHLIEDLRAQFVPFNQGLAPDFPEEYSDQAMDRNLERFLARADRGAMRIFLARDSSTNRYVGFCMTTIDENKEGSIDSFFVASDYRGGGIGRELLQRTLDWLENLSAASVKLYLLPENKGARRFYERFGFRPLSLMMKRLKDR